MSMWLTISPRLSPITLGRNGGVAVALPRNKVGAEPSPVEVTLAAGERRCCKSMSEIASRVENRRSGVSLPVAIDGKTVVTRRGGHGSDLRRQVALPLFSATQENNMNWLDPHA